MTATQDTYIKKWISPGPFAPLPLLTNSTGELDIWRGLFTSPVPKVDYHPKRGLSPLITMGDYLHPLERIITTPLVDFGILHQYEEKSE